MQKYCSHLKETVEIRDIPVGEAPSLLVCRESLPAQGTKCADYKCLYSLPIRMALWALVKQGEIPKGTSSDLDQIGKTRLNAIDYTNPDGGQKRWWQFKR